MSTQQSWDEKEQIHKRKLKETFYIEDNTKETSWDVSERELRWSQTLLWMRLGHLVLASVWIYNGLLHALIRSWALRQKPNLFLSADIKFWTQSDSDFDLINVSSFCVVYQTFAAIFPFIHPDYVKASAGWTWPHICRSLKLTFLVAAAPYVELLT